jgi:hypothetical protein
METRPEAIEGYYEAQIFHHYSELKSQVNLLQIPPDLYQLDAYRKATSSGYIPPNASLDREPISLYFKHNEPLKLCDPIEKFSQMGFGYTYIFYLAKFLIFLGFFPILVYGIIMMIVFGLGDGCVSQSKYNSIRENVHNFNDLPFLRLQIPESPVPDKLFAFYTSEETHDVMRKFMGLNCILNSSSYRCHFLDDNNCQRNYTKDCEKVNIDLFIDNYANQLCRKDALSTISAGNAWNSLVIGILGTDIIDTALIFLLLASIFVFYYFQEVRYSIVHLAEPRIEDYTVLVKNLQGLGVPDLPQRLKQMFAEKGLTPVGVNLCFDTFEYRRLVRQYNHFVNRQTVIDYKRKMQIFTDDSVDEDGHDLLGARFEPTPDLRSKHNQINRELISEKKALVKEKIFEIEKEFKRGSESSLFLGSAYVSFLTIQEKEFVTNTFKPRSWVTADIDPPFGLSHNKKEELLLNVNGIPRLLKIQTAYNPNDIIWKNLGVTTRFRQYHEMLTMVVIIFVTFLNFIIIFFIKYWAANILLDGSLEGSMDRRGSNNGVEWLINFLLSLIILLFNSSLRQFVREMIMQERHSSYHSQDLKKIRILWRAQFVNKGILIALVAICLMDFYGPNGFIYTIFSIMITYMVMTPITFPFLQCKMLYRLWVKKKIERFAENRSDRPVKTMQQAIHYWLKPNFKMASCGNRFIRNFAFCLFVLPIFPLISILYIVLAIQFYWTAKFVLVKRTNKTISYSARLTRKLTDELFLCVAVFIIGCMLRDGAYNYINLNSFHLRWYHVGLLLFVLVLYFARARNLVKLFLPAKVYSNQTYFETMTKNSNSYYLCNPAYPKLSLQAAGSGAQIVDEFSYPVLPAQLLPDQDQVYAELAERDPHHHSDHDRRH